VKEAKAALSAGYRVSIVHSSYMPELIRPDSDLFKGQSGVGVYRVDWTGSSLSSKYTRGVSGFRQKLMHRLAASQRSIKASTYLNNRVYKEQLALAKRIKADLYIAHNLGALPVAAKVAAFYNTKYAFDAEDYHRGQLEDEESIDYAAITHLEDLFIPHAAYLSAASPLIALQYQEHYPQHQVVTVNNVFPVAYQKAFTGFSNKSPELKLFWFSQTVGPDRGLEGVIAAMGLLKDKNIQLTLLGSCSEANRNYFERLAIEAGLTEGSIVFLPTVSPHEVFGIARDHQIGLALEVPHVLNRDICLTNKIFTYLIAGNAVIASETSAQKQFMEHYPAIGKSFPLGDVDKLTEILSSFYDDSDALAACRRAAWELGNQKLNWEKESEKFLSKVKEVLG